MDKLATIKGICPMFTGTFHERDWKTIVQMGKSMKKLQIKMVDTATKYGLIITSREGVFNLYADKQGSGRVSGSLFLKGSSVAEITRKPIWKVFHSAARSFQSNAVIHFYPSDGLAIEYEDGMVKEKPVLSQPETVRQMDCFLLQIRINYLLEKLHQAVQQQDQENASRLKRELSDIINRSQGLLTDF